MADTEPSEKVESLSDEKTEQRKKVQMNLENCKYIRLWQASATLDNTKKNCCQLITDGEELGNR